MIKHNENILAVLEGSNNDENAQHVRMTLELWDKSEKFPVDQARRYIKMHQWSYDKFSFGVEKVLKEILPAWFLKVFFELKEFRSNKRNELASTCAVLSKIKGYPMETQDDKAFCLYEYSLEKYYKGDNDESRKSEC